MTHRWITPSDDGLHLFESRNRYHGIYVAPCKAGRGAGTVYQADGRTPIEAAARTLQFAAETPCSCNGCTIHDDETAPQLGLRLVR